MQKRCFNDAWWLYKWWNILSLQTNASKRRWHIGRVKCYTNPIYHMCRTSNAIIVRSHTNHNIWCFDFAVCTFYAHYHHHHHLSFCLCVCIGCAHGFCSVLVQIFFQQRCDIHFCFRAAINLRLILILALNCRICSLVWNLLDSITIRSNDNNYCLFLLCVALYWSIYMQFA